jgi:hypothetical protein
MNAEHAAQMLAMLARLGISTVLATRPHHHTDSPTAFNHDYDTRRVLLPEGWDSIVDSTTPPKYNAPALLHEAMHMLTQPPFLSLDETPEQWILLQVEEAYAATLGPDVLAAVQHWQLEVTEVLDPDAPGWRPYWYEGFALARKLGLLDANDKPTWQWPDWSLLTDEERDSWKSLPGVEAEE